MINDTQNSIFTKKIIYDATKTNKVFHLPTVYSSPQSVMEFGLVFDTLPQRLDKENKKTELPISILTSQKQGKIHWIKTVSTKSTQ